MRGFEVTSPGHGPGGHSRRGFIGLVGAGLVAQELPAKARITSAVMLSVLAGPFESRVKTAALAGIQAVGIGLEDEAQDKRRYVESFGMTVYAVYSPDAVKRWNAACLIAKGDVVSDATVLVEDIKLVRAPSVLLLYRTGNLKEVIDSVGAVHIMEEPGDSREVYSTLAKAGYSHFVTMEYRPKGNAVASLKKAVDGMRAALLEA